MIIIIIIIIIEDSGVGRTSTVHGRWRSTGRNTRGKIFKRLFNSDLCKKGLCDASNMFYIYFSAVIFIFDISNASSSFLYLMQRWLSNVISICVQIIKHESPFCAICMLPKCMFLFLLIEDLSQRPSWLFLHIANLCFIYLYMLFYTYFM